LPVEFLRQGDPQKLIPKWIFGRRCNYSNGRFAHGMSKLNFAGMQMYTGVVVGAFAAVFNVTFDRATQGCQGGSDLMMPTRFGIDFDKVIVIAAADDFVTQFGFFAVIAGLVKSKRVLASL
jgi:hypothetical protein